MYTHDVRNICVSYLSYLFFLFSSPRTFKSSSYFDPFEHFFSIDFDSYRMYIYNNYFYPSHLRCLLCFLLPLFFSVFCFLPPFFLPFPFFFFFIVSLYTYAYETTHRQIFDLVYTKFIYWFRHISLCHQSSLLPLSFNFVPFFLFFFWFLKVIVFVVCNIHFHLVDLSPDFLLPSRKFDLIFFLKIPHLTNLPLFPRFNLFI